MWFLNQDITDAYAQYTAKELDDRADAELLGHVLSDAMRSMPGGGAKEQWDRTDLKIEYRWVQLDENTKFCEQCGTELRNTCRYCEVPLKSRNQRFCHHCGEQLDKPPSKETGKTTPTALWPTGLA